MRNYYHKKKRHLMGIVGVWLLSDLDDNFGKLMITECNESSIYLFKKKGVVIFNIDIGLYLGIGFSILLFVFQTQRPRTTVLGQLPDSDLFEDIQTFRDVRV